MTDATAEFFGALAERAHEPLLRNTAGTIRFDLERGKRVDRWLMTVAKGDVAVSRENLGADAVLRMDKSLFDDLALGQANALAALLRGEMAIEGDLELAMVFQRLLPGPTGSSGQNRAVDHPKGQR